MTGSGEKRTTRRHGFNICAVIVALHWASLFVFVPGCASVGPFSLSMALDEQDGDSVYLRARLTNEGTRTAWLSPVTLDPGIEFLRNEWEFAPPGMRIIIPPCGAVDVKIDPGEHVDRSFTFIKAVPGRYAVWSKALEYRAYENPNSMRTQRVHAVVEPFQFIVHEAEPGPPPLQRPHVPRGH